MKELAVVNGVLPECISTLASRIVTVPLLGPVLKEGTFYKYWLNCSMSKEKHM